MPSFMNKCFESPNFQPAILGHKRQAFKDRHRKTKGNIGVRPTMRGIRSCSKG